MSTTQRELFDISMDEQANWGVRYNAILNLDDQDFLADVVTAAFDPDLRNIAIRKIEDQKLIVDIALNDPDRNIREAAIESLPNWQRDVFKQIGMHDKYWKIRRNAIERLPAIYDEYFAERLIEEEDFRVRKLAMKKLKLINIDKDMLFKLAVHAQDGEIRRAAGAMLADEKLIVSMVILVGDYLVAEEGIERIFNQEMLKQIAMKAEFAHTRMKAVQRISDQNFLANMVKSDKNLLVRETAVYSIQSIETLEVLLMLNDLELHDSIKGRLAQLTQ